ncbi:hypothetical protein HMI54_000574 [Coelomomyces lativittatus]|nr:hypothetical protein HMI55_004354 [Coelomomyces lativittatus]KAJ1515291.1 hypothetical protein HMI56_005963 [Coelomomyces lativittatus]KAJ1518458.1 hypothetical protein HMI54_000574 [Coelomomyces lativittatus]
MGQIEILSPEGLRVDGRRPNEFRKIAAKLGVLSQADGSSYLEIGNTKVLAAVFGPTECRIRSQALHDRAIVQVEFTQASFAKVERRKVRKLDRKNLEIQLQIRKTFESVIFTSQYPYSQINIYLQIMQSDGGQVQACINAATLALIDAGISMKDYVVACTVGNIDGTPLLDLNHIEEVRNIPELTMAILPRSGKIVLLQMESRLHCDRLEKSLDLASQGGHQIYSILDDIVRKNLRSTILRANRAISQSTSSL